MWTKDCNPTESDWYIIVVDGKRFPAMYNYHNNFWCGHDGKTYKPNQIEMWLDDSKVEKPKKEFDNEHLNQSKN